MGGKGLGREGGLEIGEMRMWDGPRIHIKWEEAIKERGEPKCAAAA